MQKKLSVFMVVLLAISILSGCGKDKSVQKTEEELRSEIKAEMEAEAKKEEELREQIKAELEAEQKGNDENSATPVPRQNVEKEGSEQQANENESDNPKNTGNDSGTGSEESTLGISDDTENGSNWFFYNANEKVYFDLDADGTDEEIYFDSMSGKLMVTGFEAIDIDTMFTQTQTFIIIRFNDKYGQKLNMVGILDYGPSQDIVTNLYSIIAPMGEKTFCSVGSITGEIVIEGKYNGSIQPSDLSDNVNMEDFNYLAVLLEGQGINAPVRLSILEDLQTWFGRNLFTYYTTYCSLLDNNQIYEEDYSTFLPLSVEKTVTAYTQKNKGSQVVTVQGGQDIVFLATDNKEWIGFKAEDGSQGWVHVDEVNAENFSGFYAFD